jgi:hypothetical protein
VLLPFIPLISEIGERPKMAGSGPMPAFHKADLRTI